MNNWNEGYFTDSAYTFGYYKELNPVYLRYCLLVNGVDSTPPLPELILTRKITASWDLGRA